MNLSQAVPKVIELAGKVRDYYEAEMRKWHPNYPLVGPGEDEPPPPPEEKELRDFLLTLSGDMIDRLLLIMYLGRGDFGVDDDLTEHYEALQGPFGDPESVASFMMD